eukprot:TRINITY_DN1733_c0_g1_i1.p1 TRINITY_DN1733_c0_g1~~TRINITY_DN1733_c0_g1_i1.p1  ORF type:complete len:114 (+),score=22.39 TRINITY_DN1733_c0_g1_i1:109-450(+)
MPLVKIFSRQSLKVPAATLHEALVKIWGVAKTPEVMKVLSLPVHDCSTSGEDVYVDIRAKAKPDRTPDVVNEACKQTAALLSTHGYAVNVRAELYEPSLQYSTKTSSASASKL